MADKEIVLEWKDEQTTKLEEFAKQYNDIDAQIKALTDTKNKIRSDITKLMTDYKQSKVLTENYSVSYIHVNGSRSLDTNKLKSKLIELKVEIDDSFYKVGKDSTRLDIKKKETSDTNILIENDPHRVTVSLEDLKI